MSFCEQEKKQHSTTVKAVTVEASFAKFSTFAMHATAGRSRWWRSMLSSQNVPVNYNAVIAGVGGRDCAHLRLWVKLDVWLCFHVPERQLFDNV